jgi:putative ABC transport system permease protein
VTAKLVLENLRHRPMRTALSVLLIGVPVTLILSLVGVSHGLSEDSQHRAQAIGADAVMRGTSASTVISFSGATLDEKFVPFLEKQPHVRMAMGVIVHAVDFPLNMMGVDLAQFNLMTGGFEYLEGHALQAPDDILVDKPYADQRGLHAGSTLNLVNRDWHVAGVVAPGKLARIVVPKRTLQEMDSSIGMVSIIYIKLDDPARADEFVRQIRTLLPKYRFDTMEYYTSMFAVSNIKQVTVFTYVVIGIGVVIGFTVVLLSMYMAVLQRTREIGILKSLGGSKGFILGTILVEAALLGVLGTILGIGLSYLACWAIRTFIPASFPMVIVYAWWPRAAVITLFATEIGALYPGINAASHDPIEALAYE